MYFGIRGARLRFHGVCAFPLPPPCPHGGGVDAGIGGDTLNRCPQRRILRAQLVDQSDCGTAHLCSVAVAAGAAFAAHAALSFAVCAAYPASVASTNRLSVSCHWYFTSEGARMVSNRCR